MFDIATMLKAKNEAETERDAIVGRMASEGNKYKFDLMKQKLENLNGVISYNERCIESLYGEVANQ